MACLFQTLSQLWQFKETDSNSTRQLGLTFAAEGGMPNSAAQQL